MKYKNDFLNTLENNNTKHSFLTLFEQIIEFEKIIGKNIKYFNKEEILALLSYCCKSKTYHLVYTKWSLIKKFLLYIGNYNENLVTKYDLNAIMNKRDNLLKYIPKEYLINIINQLENDSDKCLLMLLRNGIGMQYEVRDLIDIKESDVDLYHKTISGKHVDDYTFYLIEKTLNEKEYTSLGAYEKVIVYNPNSEYLFKTRPTSRTNDGLLPLRPSGVRGRLQKIREILNDDSIVLTNLIYSFLVDDIVIYQQNIGRELTIIELKKYLNDKFGIGKNIYNIKEMMQEVKIK